VLAQNPSDSGLTIDGPVRGWLLGLAGLAQRRPAWHARAACVGSGLDFHPERGEDVRAQKECCGGCEVRVQCLNYGLEHGEKQGIWGGLSERERRKLRSVCRSSR
jgi:WhiB family redox-sensing transcriptional regulator